MSLLIAAQAIGATVLTTDKSSRLMMSRLLRLHAPPRLRGQADMPSLMSIHQDSSASITSLRSRLNSINQDSNISVTSLRSQRTASDDSVGVGGGNGGVDAPSLTSMDSNVSITSLRSRRSTSEDSVGGGVDGVGDDVGGDGVGGGGGIGGGGGGDGDRGDGVGGSGGGGGRDSAGGCAASAHGSDGGDGPSPPPSPPHSPGARRRGVSAATAVLGVAVHPVTPSDGDECASDGDGCASGDGRANCDDDRGSSAGGVGSNPASTRRQRDSPRAPAQLGSSGRTVLRTVLVGAAAFHASALWNNWPAGFTPAASPRAAGPPLRLPAPPAAIPSYERVLMPRARRSLEEFLTVVQPLSYFRDGSVEFVNVS